jgi:hypothetical protein
MAKPKEDLKDDMKVEMKEALICFTPPYGKSRCR